MSAGLIAQAFTGAFADNDPSGSPHKPAKADARGLGAAIEFITNAVLPSQSGFGLPIVDDFDGCLGGGPAVYVPQAFYVNRGDLPNATFNVTLTPPAAELAGYVKVPLDGKRTTATTIYVDFGLLYNGNTGAVAAVTSSGQVDPKLGSNFFKIYRRLDGDRSSPFRHVQATDLNKTALWFDDPMVLQLFPDGGTQLFIPPFYAWRADKGFQKIAPASGRFFEFVIDTTGRDVTRLYLDWQAVEKNVQPFVNQSAGLNPPHDGYIKPTIARSWMGKVQSEYPIVMGPVGDFPSGANRLTVGRAFNAAPNTAGAALQFVTIADPFLTGAGFGVGWNSGASAGGDVTALIGGPIEGDLGDKAWMFARVYLLVTSDNDWTAPGSTANPDERADLYVTMSDGAAYLYAGIFEKAWSNRVASFIFRGQLYGPGQGKRPVAWTIGGRDYSRKGWVWTGAQACFADRPVHWIDRFDYPGNPSKELTRQTAGALGSAFSAAPDFVLPAKLYLAEGSRLRLFPANALPAPGGMLGYIAAVSSDAGAGAPTLTDQGESVEIDASRVGASLELTLHSRATGAVQLRRSMQVVKVPAQSSASVVFLGIGDSIMHRDALLTGLQEMRARGMSVTSLGTVSSTTDGGTVDGTDKMEGREGWEAQHYTNAHTTLNGQAIQPLAAGQESAYLAMTDAQKLLVNPFIRPATGNDPAAIVNNGYVFDLAFYLQRFGFPTPTHLGLAVGGNDWLHAPVFDGTLSAAILKAYGTIYSQARAALGAGVPIAMALHKFGEPTTFNRVPYNHAYVMKTTMQFSRQSGVNVDVLPAYLFQSPFTGWSYTVVATDAQGLDTVTLADDLHSAPGSPYRRIYGQVWANWVSGTVPGTFRGDVNLAALAKYIGTLPTTAGGSVPRPWLNNGVLTFS